MRTLTEQQANEWVLDLLGDKPMDEVSRAFLEDSAIMTIHTVYKNGGEIVIRESPAITLGDIKKMKEDGVIY